MERKTHSTLFIWMEGLFPKTIVYYLLLKGLADTHAQLYEGRTNDPRLEIRVISFTGSGFKSSDPNDPKPTGKSSPCLRVVDENDPNKTAWIHDSTSILRYLEEIYPQEPRMMSPEALERAAMQDCLAAVYQGFDDCNYYVKNATAVTGSWSGIRNEDRSLPIAIHAKQSMVRSFEKVQGWTAQSLEVGGWLTPGVQGPGLVDAALAAGVRYLDLSYSVDLLEDEKLGPLRGWYARFKSLPWWEENEERRRHPKEMSFPPGCCEV